MQADGSSTSDGEASPPPPPPASSLDSITCVKLGSGQSHCYFCDTLIEQGWPCVERVWHHSGGRYRRNNGAAAGHCSAGLAPESAHAQCAFRLDANTRGKIAQCQACKRDVEPCRRVVNFIANPLHRCSETSPLYLCFGCTSAFVQRYRGLLDGHLGADQQTQGVAYIRHRPLFCPPGLQAGCGLPPLTPSAKADYLAIFRASSAAAEALAVTNHRELQAKIVAALGADSACGNGTDKAKQRRGGAAQMSGGTPVERKARAMRIDSGGARKDEAVDGRMMNRDRSRSRSPSCSMPMYE